MFIFVDTAFVVGGIKTLMLREAQWLHNQGEKICVIGRYFDSEVKRRLSELQIKYVVVSESNSLYTAVLENIESKEDSIQFFGFEVFLSFYLQNPESNLKFHLYCVNPIGMHLGKKYKIIKPLLKSSVKKVVKGLSNDGNIMYVDSQTLLSNIKYYDINKSECKWRFMPLPYQVTLRDNISMNSDTISILAIARASFPFKGYLLGLIDTLDKNLKDMPKFRLTIISVGDDLEMLKERINSADELLKSVTTLIEGVRAEDLHLYYSNSNLFIGMGTTVLEAAECGAAVIVAAPHTNDFLSEGFFHENNKNLGGGNLTKQGWNDIKKYISLPKAMRVEISKKTQQALSYYDENLILNEMYCNLNAPKYRLPLFNKCILKLYFQLKGKLLK